ncbi:hypothetical protein NFHSH190041_15070 [Shewanella sp. NFH-SH190041]|uniref:exodeoxyribonuclease V subunit beta n=1 Tax=Shewanella sp. NFH-SH190041 TaxID=2950245 RepID=UPI0021C275BA|nr:exodeoxyribonuclease V subunit beta [Shewanella sp. NFH-SH190041]BDM64055.1 hypothetical protein NFHSH190041_15070 [Shewanella sp. NFH-SH190041]
MSHADAMLHTLDPLTLPLKGRRLIEASAGTGKTYTISGLYLRLLLGHGDTAPLTCEQILVVTFTNAATEELRDRIRKRIKLCYQRFIGLPVEDAFIDTLFAATEAAELPIARRRLDLALKSLDEAAIFTIHGFCQRILSDMAFESALLFESTFVLDDSQYLSQSVRDYWRYTCYQLPEYLAGAIAAKFDTPDDLGRQLRPLFGASQASADTTPPPFSQVCEQLTSKLEMLRELWLQERQTTEILLHSLPLNGTSYGKESDGYPKLATMLARMDNWAKYQAGLPDSKLLTSLSLSQLKLKKGGILPEAEQAKALVQIELVSEAIAALLPAFLYAAREQIENRFMALKAERNVLSPDDLLLTLALALGQHSRANPDSHTNQTSNLSSNSSSGSDSNSSENSHQENGSEQDQIHSQDTALNTDDHQARIAQRLRQCIASRFPVALIDEFQDTDPLQYGIFSGIYPTQQCHESGNTLLMIGDPKQAIYAFRGADIFTYIQARNATPDRYNLATNYRSSQAMVTAVNRVFTHHAQPFLNDAIPFDSVNAKDDGSKQLIGPDNNLAALQLRLLPEHSKDGLNKTTARRQLAADAAEEITQLLNGASAPEPLCLLQNKDHTEPVKARDIAILVRDRNEAAVMEQALRSRGVGAVFLSRDSVMQTTEAREIALILQALANPRDETAIRSAMASRLLGYDANTIHEFNQSENLRSKILEQFMRLHELWSRRGIMPALLLLADECQLLERLSREPDAERRLTDFRHLAELLQQKSAELDGIAALLGWFEQELGTGQSGEEQQLRLASEQNLVQIVTIHKSKGLEYPICFIPFVSLARDSNRRPAPMLYHRDDQLIWDLNGSDDGWEQCKLEVMAEDLRLLYVALTRPVYRCYLYIANHCRMNKSGINSYLANTAIGYLLGIQDNKCDADTMTASAQTLACEAISVSQIIPTTQVTQLKGASEQQQLPCSPAVPAKRPQVPWRVGSYSGLVKHLPHEYIQPGAGDEELSDDAILQQADTEPQPSRFTFERGANAGTFMHLVLELIDFTRAETGLPTCLPGAMEQYGIDAQWQEILTDWYLDLLHAPLTGHKGNPIQLAQLDQAHKLVELEFYLPLGDDASWLQDRGLKDIALSQLLARFGYGGELKFDEFKGMLKGFIDLTFEYQGRYYIADYKSNYLGDDYPAYNQENMAQAIHSHRYDLQYIIYTLALHRYLRLKLPDYDYQQHFGGCYYLFLRGMSASQPGCGVFFDKPDFALIDALDALLSGQQAATSQWELTL